MGAMLINANFLPWSYTGLESCNSSKRVLTATTATFASLTFLLAM